MHLTPQHFQAQRRFQEDQSARTVDLLFPFSYGLSAVEIDADALSNGALRAVHLRGVLPDGTPFHVPDADRSPESLTLADFFSPTRSDHVVHLALPRWRGDSANVLDETAGSIMLSTPRFRAVEDTVIDESTGNDPLAVKFATRNLSLVLDEQVTDDMVSMPIARVQRDGRGQFKLDTDFVPPTLNVGASVRLMSLLQRTVSLLEAKSAALAASINIAPAAAAGGAAAYVGNELATRWLLHAVRSADAPLRHLLMTRRAHPERLYLELSRLVGALTTFAISAHPRDIPLYDHENLTTCFDSLERQLRLHLDIVVSASALIIPLQRTSDVMHVAAIQDARCFEPGARWFLAVHANIAAADLYERVPRLTKTCASKFVMELVRRAFNGLPTEFIATPPAGLAPKANLAYFELTLSGPCALSLAESREIGVYVPEAIPGAYVELAVLVPSSSAARA